jgi:hypothetical protein
MPWSTIEGVFFLLGGLGSAGIGIGVRLSPPDNFELGQREAHQQQRWSQIGMWLWRIGWTLWGLGFVCLGLATVRDLHGRYITVPASAPLFDRMTWVLLQVGIYGGFAALVLWMAVRSAQRKRLRREGSDT